MIVQMWTKYIHDDIMLNKQQQGQHKRQEKMV